MNRANSKMITPRERFMVSTSVGEKNESFFIKVLKLHLNKRVLKTFERKFERESLKKTISASNGFGLLQMVSKPDNGQYASKEGESQRGMDTRPCVNKDVGPLRRVDCEIQHRLRRRTNHSL